MSFLELAKERYSVRKFSDKKVEDEKLELILEAGRIAPTAKNYQPQRTLVLRSEENIAKLNKLTPCVYGATTATVTLSAETLLTDKIAGCGVLSVSAFTKTISPGLANGAISLK